MFRSYQFISISKQVCGVVKMSSDSCKVWARFERTNVEGQLIRMRIQDVPDRRRDEAIEMFHNYFMTEEPLSRAYSKKMADDELAKADDRSRWDKFLKSSAIIVVCLNDESPLGEIIGVSVSYIIRRGDYDLKKYKHKSSSQLSQEVLRIILEIHGKYDPFKTFPDVNVYLDDAGITVHPKYRGMGICGEFLKCRRLQCKDLQADMTGGWMTSLASQRAAVKDGWTEAAEFNFEEIARMYGLSFEDTPPTIKVMVARVS